MRAVALVGCLVLAVFVPNPPQPTDTDVPPTTSLLSASSTSPEVEEPETVAPADEVAPPPAPPMMAEGIDVEPPPMTAARVVHGCDASAEDLCTKEPPPRPVWQWCEEWHDMADQVGWPESQGYVLSYVMHRESGCKPSAYNRSGATGLLQLLGWSCPPNGCFDPWSNLSKGLELWERSGWCPWVLRGDPVTGRACG